MHNLALALHQQGHAVTGSDDEIFEPSRSRLMRAGLYPKEMGWYPERITAALDAIILGMHARLDNPELLRAQRLGLPVYSYPEFIYRQSETKTRIVIGGSHGKTTITSMIMHVLKHQKKPFDYLVGSQIEGFETMVELNPHHAVVVIEGDEYFASPIQMIPKFHLYHPHIAVLSGIAWDHINVFPSFELYLDAFKQFIEKMEQGGTLIWYGGDAHLKTMVESGIRSDLKYLSYQLLPHIIKDQTTYIKLSDGQLLPLEFFGAHNLMNMEAAQLVCKQIGIETDAFYQAISTFKGAARRLEVFYKDDTRVVFRDFAHSPSKLKATIEAVTQQFPDRNIACLMELHTFSSLNKDFLPQYVGCMNNAKEAVVYYNPETISHKKLPSISAKDIKDAFQHPALRVISDLDELKLYIQSLRNDNRSVLLMSSGNWGGTDIAGIFKV